MEYQLLEFESEEELIYELNNLAIDGWRASGPPYLKTIKSSCFPGDVWVYYQQTICLLIERDCG
jgi:hypothetical protein